MSDAPADLPQWLRWLAYLVQQVGFPIVVAWFVLVRLNGKLGKLTDALLEVAATFQAVKAELASHAIWSREAMETLRDEIRESIREARRR